MQVHIAIYPRMLSTILLRGNKMFETNMIENLAQQSALKAIQGDHTNTWRKLVSKEFRQYLDSISTVKMIEENCDE